MMLFQRTLLSFIGIILLQGALSIVFVTSSLKKSQFIDLRRELDTEALKVYDNINAWKRLLWKVSIDIHEDKKLSELIQEQTTVAFDPRLDSFLSETAKRSGADFLIARSGSMHYTKTFTISGKQFPVPRDDYFVYERGHPYIETILLNNTLYFVGTLRVGDPDKKHIDIFLVKVIDEGLCGQLSFNPRIRVLLSVDSLYSVGTFGDESLRQWLSDHPLLNSYTPIETIVQNNISYSAIVQQSGMVRVFSGTTNAADEDFYISTFFSRSEYKHRIESIYRMVLTVSLVIALFTMVVSLLLANSITSPIRRLRKAMSGIARGNLDTVVVAERSGEMAELLRGFNDMATQLAADQAATGEYIAEIIRLKEYNDKIFNSIREGLLVINSVFKIEKANQAFLDYFNLGIDEILGKNIDVLSSDLFDDNFHASIRKILFGSEPLDFQIRRAATGISYEVKLYPLYEMSRPENDRFHCILIIEDISRRIAYEEGIFQAEKLAGISMLSAGVAHEINNPLSSILINVQNLLAADMIEKPSADLKIIEKETKRIARIVRNLLDFSATRIDDRSGSDINTVIEEVLQLIRYSIHNESQIDLETSFADSLALVSIGQDELKQIILNLIKNSLQAIGPGGTIEIQTAAATAERRVVVTVRDTGCGIDPDILPRIFDPFFTTKGSEGNTGLGLSVVYGIVTKCGGTISVESALGQGTSMRIELPYLER